MWNMTHASEYRVATVSRIDKIIGLFCRRASHLQGSFAEETYNFIDSTKWSHLVVAPGACVSYISHMNESWCTCEWVMAHMNESCFTCRRVLVENSVSCCISDLYFPYEWVRYISHLNESWRTCEWVMAHMWMSHGTHTNETRPMHLSSVSCCVNRVL